MTASPSAPVRSPRLHSLDALRGLDMLIILRLDALVLLLASGNPGNAFLRETARQMAHAHWEGLHLYDLVFPVFVFIWGVSMFFSLATYAGGNSSAASGLFHLWKRASALAVLGLLVNGTLTWTEGMRYSSVLELIGFSCAIVGTFILLCRRTGAIAAAAGGILVLVALLQFNCGSFTPDASVNSWVDRRWLPGRLHGGVFDPEGPLCIVSASALCMGGWLAGKLLKENGTAAKNGAHGRTHKKRPSRTGEAFPEIRPDANRRLNAPGDGTTGRTAARRRKAPPLRVPEREPLR